MSEKCNCGHDHEHDHECCCGHDHTEDHDCCCGHDHEEVDTIFLTLDDDSEMECHIIGTFELDGKEYIALLPVDDEAVLLYIFKEENDELELTLIEDDEEFERVSEEFYALFGGDEDEE